MSTAITYYERALHGERISEKEFDNERLPFKLADIVKKHEITYDRKEVLSQDLDMAKRVFAAAVDLVSEVGIYVRDTESILAISAQEVHQAVANAPTSEVFGTGPQQFNMRARGISDTQRPRIIGGLNGAPVPEEHVMDLFHSYALQPVDGLHTGSIISIFGQEVRAKTPHELLVCKYEALWAREALLRAGKPGAPILGIMSGSTSEAQNAGDFEGGLRPSDMHLVVFLNEMKADADVFNKIAHNQFHGNILDACMGGPTIGGYAGGPESAAVVATAEILAAYVLSDPSMFSMYPVNMFSGVSSDKWTIWMSTMSALALKSSGADFLLAMYQGAAAGPCTEMIISEIAAQTVAQAAAGISFMYGPVGRSMNTPGYYSGMEARILCEISRAAAGLSLEQAADLALRLNSEYEESVMKKDCPKGQHFTECWDKKNLRPTAEYLELWDEQKNKLAKMGLSL